MNEAKNTPSGEIDEYLLARKASMVEMKSPLTKRSGKGSSVKIDNYHARKRHETTVKGGLKKLKVKMDNPTGIKGCLDAVMTLLEVFGMDSRKGYGENAAAVQAGYQKTLINWTRLAESLGKGGWMKFVKYKLAAFFHAHTEQLDVAPESPLDRYNYSLTDSPSKLCNGIVGKYALYLVRSPARDEFLASILQVKKGCPRPDKSLVEAQVKKSVIALTTSQNPHHEQQLIPNHIILDPESKVVTELNDQAVNMQLRRTVRELFKNSKYTDKDRLNPIFPSTSATFEDTRAQGGQFRSIRKLAIELGLCSFEAMIDDVHEIERGVGQSNVKFELVAGEEYIGAPRYSLKANVDMLRTQYDTLYLEALRRALLELPLVKPVGLAESLKVRVITKGPPLTAFVMKPLQKFTWRTLKRHPAFCLIGEPADRWNVRERLGNELEQGEAYLSGDYSAATDNLAPWVSNIIADEIATCIELTDDERTLFVRSLTGHTFVDDKLSTFVEQKWGQLMGSVTSFPILCIANAAMCRWSLEVAYRKDMTIAESTIMINGDDVVFKTTAEGLQLWKDITTYIGLTPSIGKYFFSREFAQINSANFKRVENTEPERWGTEYDDDGNETDIMMVNPFVQTKFVNLGLLFGLKRSGEKVGVDAVADTIDGLGVRCRDLIRQAPLRLHANIMRSFVKEHWLTLKSVHVPWFMPEKWGGIGLPEVADEDGNVLFGGITTTDLQLAHRIREEPKAYPVRALPAIGSWHVHKFISERYPIAATNSNPSNAATRSADRLYALLAVDCLFTVKDLHKEKETNVLSILRRNEKSWTKAGQTSHRPKPLSEDTVRNTYTISPILDVEIIDNHNLIPNLEQED